MSYQTWQWGSVSIIKRNLLKAATNKEVNIIYHAVGWPDHHQSDIEDGIGNDDGGGDDDDGDGDDDVEDENLPQGLNISGHHISSQVIPLLGLP